MKYEAGQMEEQAVLETAAKMCAAARTAPKAKGLDRIVTLVLTGEEKDALADKMHEVANREFGDAPSTFHRDAENLRAASAVVLIGIRPMPCVLLALRLHELCRVPGSRGPVQLRWD